ncbi:class A beta-lactamase [Chthonobacter rhizosphaerae]|uniref:class A beta-lactamase n=1 Tax=Chthonobacter rhizosphaerae TaxID=2735553 RepID=UPI0015EEEAB3|nr:class A beta-lactamase [Chthonobacter rhizosphaerae]
MTQRPTRRCFTLITAGLAAIAAFGPAVRAEAASTGRKSPETRIADLEKRLGGRIGVAVVGVRSGPRWTHRQDERFPMASTFKVLAAAALLNRVDAGAESLDRLVRYRSRDLVTYSPETERHVKTGMTLADLCHAAVTRSDNTAGNLILQALGGPEAITAFARSLGDRDTRLDRWETALNEARPGDPRDTTTPAAMAADLRELLFGGSLSDASRERLAGWMIANTTGDARLRAGLPDDWRVGDKTGTGENGATADVAVIWPGDGEPVLAAVYMADTAASFDDRNRAFAEIGRILAADLDA